MRNYRLAVSVIALVVTGACSTPSAPTPPPAPPVIAEPPEITCAASVTVAAGTSAGADVPYALAESRKGQGTVSVACTPSSGTRFPIGATPVQCVATDSMNRTASCSFSVTVAGPPRLRRTRIMAWGDSLTEGATVLSNDPYDTVHPPETAYPTVLNQLLSARYTDQTITVLNRGLPGEQAWRALSRFIQNFVADAPDIVVLHEGYNDIRVGQIDKNESLGITNAIYGITELAGEARRRGARVFICTLAPSRPGRLYINTSAIEYVNDHVRQVARTEGAVLVDIYAALAPDVNANVSIDGLHLSPLGYRRVAEAVAAAIRADLEVK